MWNEWGWVGGGVERVGGCGRGEKRGRQEKIASREEEELREGVCYFYAQEASETGGGGGPEAAVWFYWVRGQRSETL